VKAPLKKKVNVAKSLSTFIVSATDNVNEVEGVKMRCLNYIELALGQIKFGASRTEQVSGKWRKHAPH
jgi:hypothetical protein